MADLPILSVLPDLLAALDAGPNAVLVARRRRWRLP
jgi:hypothetical protein